MLLRSLLIVSVMTASAARAANDPFAGSSPYIEVMVRPAAAPVPALSVQLYPTLLEETVGNAALPYLKAGLALPSREALNRAMDWCDLSLDELAESGATIDAPELGGPWLYDFLRDGARCRYCSWQTSVSATVLIPEMATMRHAARLLDLRARLQALSGDIDGAIESLGVGFSLAHDFASGPTVIQALVGSAIGSMFADTCRDLAGVPGMPNLYWALTDLPQPLVDVRPSLRSERYLTDLMLPQIALLRAGPIDEVAWPGVLQGLIDGLRGSLDTDAVKARAALTMLGLARYPDARDRLIATGRTKAEVEAMPIMEVVLADAGDQYAILRDDMYKWLAMSYPEARRRIDAVGGGTRQRSDITAAGWPFIELVPAIDRIIGQQAAMERRFAALRCVEALRLYADEHGMLPESLDDIMAVVVPHDPYQGRPFAYRRLAPDRAELVGDAAATHTGHTLRYRIHLVR